MNYARLTVAFFVAVVAYFACGFALFAALPGMKTEYLKYPGVYRAEPAMMKAMPYNMVAILVGIAVVAVLYAKMHPVGGGDLSGLTLGALIGVFAACTYAVHNYALLNIGPRLTLYEAATSVIQWLVVGAAIGAIYRPS